jgi:quercetin dioxygenase-like cupin family protein
MTYWKSSLVQRDPTRVPDLLVFARAQKTTQHAMKNVRPDLETAWIELEKGCGIKSVKVIGCHHFREARFGLRPHQHGHGRMEILYLAKGRQTFMVSGETFRMRGGDVLIVFPDEMHSTGDAPEEIG